MQFFLKKEVQSFVNSNGHKKTAFYIGEGTGDKIYEIKGISSNNSNDVDIAATLRTKNHEGRMITQHKVFRLKKSGINNLLRESRLKLVSKDDKKVLPKPMMDMKRRGEEEKMMKMKKAMMMKKRTKDTKDTKDKSKKVMKKKDAKDTKDAKDAKDKSKKMMKEKKPKSEKPMKKKVAKSETKKTMKKRETKK